MTTVVEAAYAPILQFFGDDGTFLVGGQLYTTVGGIPYPTYADAQGLVQHANPIILNSRGEIATSSGQSAQLYLIPNVTYTFALFDSLNNPIDTPTNVQGIPNDQSILALITQSFIGSVLYPQTAAEADVAVTPIFYNYEPGDIRRYGVLFDGSDESNKVQNWVSPGGNLTFPVPQTVQITTGAVMVGNTTLKAVQGATIQSATHDLVFLSANMQSNVIIDGLTFNLTSAGTAPGAAGIVLSQCAYSAIQNCQFIGMQYYGIWAPGLTDSTLSDNVFQTGAANTLQDSADIDLSSPTTPSLRNLIIGNHCFGGGEFGIAVWDQYGGILPAFNVVQNNWVGGGNSGYGILLYLPDAGDTFNSVIGNVVQGVLGNLASNPSSGAGIYMVGAGAGGTKICNNTIFNCCVDTGNESLAPAGIGLNGTASGSAPITIQGNVISLMTQYHGIYLTGVMGGATVSGNTINMPGGNSTGGGIKIANSFNVTCTANTIELVTTTQPQFGILLEANGASNNNITVANNTIQGGHSSQIRTVQVGGNSNTGIVISGNQLTGGDASCTPLVLDGGTSAQNVMISNNNIRANTQPAVTQGGCTFVRYTGNFMLSTGTVTLSFTGTNSSSFLDRSNIGFPIGAAVNNAGSGLIIEQLGQLSPTAGTWAIGDTIRNSAPSAGNVYEWICTTAGTPGTFRTISNS